MFKYSVILALDIGKLEYYIIARQKNAWLIKSIQGACEKSLIFKRQRVVYNCDHFLFFCAPLRASQLDYSLYKYVLSRFQQVDEFEEHMMVDYALIREDKGKLLIGMAYEQQTDRWPSTALIDSCYLSMFRFILHTNGSVYMHMPVLVVGVDKAGIWMMAFGGTLWGYSRYVGLSMDNASLESMLPSMLKANPVVLNNIEARMYLVAQPNESLLSLIDHCWLEPYCVIDPIRNIVSQSCKHLWGRSNSVAFIIGSRLWGSI